MPAPEVKIHKREAVAEGTMAFHFEKPPDFYFKAGQSIKVTLIDPPQTDAEGNARTFSLVSALGIEMGRKRWRGDECRDQREVEQCFFMGRKPGTA